MSTSRIRQKLGTGEYVGRARCCVSEHARTGLSADFSEKHTEMVLTREPSAWHNVFGTGSKGKEPGFAFDSVSRVAVREPKHY